MARTRGQAQAPIPTPSGEQHGVASPSPCSPRRDSGGIRAAMGVVGHITARGAPWDGSPPATSSVHCKR